MSSKKTCEGCGKKFTCELKQECWCKKMDLTSKHRHELKKKYADCLCPDCLLKISKQ